MVEQDTIRLLRECDAGVDMGVKGIEDCLSSVTDEHFRNFLVENKKEHEQLKREIGDLLKGYHDSGKDSHPIVETMSKMKTTMKLMMDDSDESVADILTDGTNMGVKSLNKFLNEYKAADEKSKDIAKRLINLEEALTIKMREYL